MPDITRILNKTWLVQRYRKGFIAAVQKNYNSVIPVTDARTETECMQTSSKPLSEITKKIQATHPFIFSNDGMAETWLENNIAPL